jgi:hypothetical protein
LQPILARLPRLISDTVLAGGDRNEAERQRTADRVGREAEGAAATGFDLDAVTPQDLQEPQRPRSPLTMDDLVARNRNVWPPGLSLRPLAGREYALLLPGLNAEVRVSTNSEFVEQHAENVELWSPGSPLFQPPQLIDGAEPPTTQSSIRELLGASPN